MDQSTLLANAREIFESDDPKNTLKELGIAHDHDVTERVIHRSEGADTVITIHTYT